nr:NUMOD4 domain-containing protein [Mycobacterium paragordonae]
MTEQWRPVVGYEGLYEVSDHGRVRSLERVVMRRNGAPCKVRGRILRQGTAKTGGYKVVNLAHPGRSCVHKVHHLVLAAFVGPRPTGLLGLHADDDPTNNGLTNLSYGTHSDNRRDSIRNGTHPMASRTHCVGGHEFTSANTYLWRGVRLCKTCRTSCQRRRRQSRRNYQNGRNAA